MRSGDRIDEEAELAGDVDEAIGRGTGAIGVCGPAPQVAIGEPAHGVDDQLLIVIECEVHEESRIAFP
jgi:hypothetical protein